MAVPPGGGPAPRILLPLPARASVSPWDLQNKTFHRWRIPGLRPEKAGMWHHRSLGNKVGGADPRTILEDPVAGKAEPLPGGLGLMAARPSPAGGARAGPPCATVTVFDRPGGGGVLCPREADCCLLSPRKGVQQIARTPEEALARAQSQEQLLLDFPGASGHSCPLCRGGACGPGPPFSGGAHHVAQARPPSPGPRRGERLPASCPRPPPSVTLRCGSAPFQVTGDRCRCVL